MTKASQVRAAGTAVDYPPGVDFPGLIDALGDQQLFDTASRTSGLQKREPDVRTRRRPREISPHAGFHEVTVLLGLLRHALLRRVVESSDDDGRHDDRTGTRPRSVVEQPLNPR